MLLPDKKDSSSKRSPAVDQDIQSECLLAPEEDDQGDMVNAGSSSLTSPDIDSGSPLSARIAQFHHQVDKMINALEKD